MEMNENRTLTKEVQELIAVFDALTGRDKLEFLKQVIEKMENGEVELDGREVVPGDIGISDGYESCRKISDLL